jgi:hypothetical protein
VLAAFGVCDSFAWLEPHGALHLEKLGQELAQEEQNQAQMCQQNSDLAPSELQPVKMGRHEVDQEQPTEQIPARPDRDSPAASWRAPANNERLKVLALCFPKAQVDFRQRSREHQHRRHEEARNRQAEGGKESKKQFGHNHAG